MTRFFRSLAPTNKKTRSSETNAKFQGVGCNAAPTGRSLVKIPRGKPTTKIAVAKAKSIEAMRQS